MQDIVITLSYIIELIVLSYAEYGIWRTLYTPFFFLALPYTAVLFITILITTFDIGFCGLYYPSILIWNVGLFLFFIPSLLTGIAMRRQIESAQGLPEIKPAFGGRLFYGVSVVLGVLFLIRFWLVFRSSSYIPGSEDFGDDFCGSGLWAHLRSLCMAYLILLIYLVEKKCWYYAIPIGMFLFVAVMYGVKGWIIVSVVSGVFMRAYTGRTKLKFSLVFKAALGGFLLFQVIYLLSWVVAGNSTMSWYVVEYIGMHFLHYFTSGVLGMSIDLVRGLPDLGDTQVLFTPLVNIYNVLTGQDIISPTNPIFHHNGVNLTNVRTYFGTILIYTNWYQFILFILLFSFMHYISRVWLLLRPTSIVLAIYCFFCALICLGWFEYYYFHLAVIETPILMLLLSYLSRLR